SFSPFSCVGLLSDFFLMGLHLFLSKECFTILNKIELPSQKKRQPHINKVMFQMKRIIFSLLKILRFLLNPDSFLIPGREYVQPLFPRLHINFGFYFSVFPLTPAFCLAPAF